jgi:light-regulated signal transduction histidine kinase (bacteriophytochrome)
MLMSVARPAMTSTDEEIRLRARVAELERQVHDQAARLSAATSELETFSQSMSHDLRAPLRCITGFTRSLLEDHGTELGVGGRRTLHLISEEARRMGRLIEDLVAYARVGRRRPSVAAIDMTELARSAFQELVELRTSPVPALQVDPLPAANADRLMVREIFTRLLENALKFAPLPEAEIRITGSIDGEWSTYCVTDNGVGFDQRYAHKLFGVFQRLHRAEDFEGSGVGLAVVQRIVHLHGGRMWAVGEVNMGATFGFTLPSFRGGRA